MVTKDVILKSIDSQIIHQKNARNKFWDYFKEDVSMNKMVNNIFKVYNRIIICKHEGLLLIMLILERKFGIFEGLLLWWIYHILLLCCSQ